MPGDVQSCWICRAAHHDPRTWMDTLGPSLDSLRFPLGLAPRPNSLSWVQAMVETPKRAKFSPRLLFLYVYSTPHANDTVNNDNDNDLSLECACTQYYSGLRHLGGRAHHIGPLMRRFVHQFSFFLSLNRVLV